MTPSLKPVALGIATAAALAAGAANAGEIRIWKQPNYSGDVLTLRDDRPTLSRDGFKNQVSSIVIHSGRWELCSQPDFKGDCVVMGPGEYPKLDQQLTNRLESIREVTPRYADNDRYRGRDRDDRPPPPRYREDRYAYSYDSGYLDSGAIELFAGIDFRGRSRHFDGDAPTLYGFDQRASSMVINEGRWQLCTEPGFEGYCRVFERGRYPHLGRLNNQIGSVRRVG